VPAELTLNPDVVCSALPEGGVLLHLETKQYFALNATGLLVWQFLEDGGTIADLRAGLRDDEVADVEAFAGTLVSHGLAGYDGAHTAGSTSPVPALLRPSAWQPPSVTPHGRPLAQVILSPFDPTVPIPE